jgi:hypothetical protein
MEQLTRLRAGAAAAQAVTLQHNLIQALEQLRGQLGSPELVLAALNEHVANPNPNSPAGLVLTQLGVNTAELAEFLEKNDDLLLLLFQPVQALHGRTLSYPLSAQQGAAGAGWSVEGEASLAASLEGDADGDLLDRMITFDPAREVFLRVGAEGKVKGSGQAAGNVAAGVGAKGAFSAGASVAIDNFFRHRTGQGALTALAADLPMFKLPAQIGAGSDLRSEPLPGGLRLPGQYVRLNGTGNLQVGGSLSWSRTALSTARVNDDSLDVDSQLLIHTGVSAEASFSYSLEGTFDILVHASPDSANRVRVKLSKSRASSSELGFKFEVGVGIEGLDGLGKDLLAGFLPKLDALIARLDQGAQQFADLRALLDAKVDGQINALLGRQRVTQQIQAFLTTIGADVDLRQKLKEVLVEAVDSTLGPLVDNIQNQVTPPLVNGVKELIRRYRRTIERINSALQKAAQVKIALSFGRTRRAVEASAVAFEVDVDPQQNRDVYRRLLEGDFTALSASGVIVIGGSLRESGSLTISDSLSFTAFGFSFNQATILKQEWTAQVSATGEVTIGVSSSLTASTALLRRERTARFLADAHVLAMLLDNGTLSGTSFRNTAHLELTTDFQPRNENQMAQHQALLQRLGALPATAPDLVKELVFAPQSATKKYGTLTSSAVLDLDRADLDALLDADDTEAQTEMIKGLADFFAQAGHPWLRIVDSRGVPFLLWSEVQGLLGGVTGSGGGGSLEFQADDGQTSFDISIAQRPLLQLDLELLRSFRQVFRGLRQIRDLGPVPGETREQLLQRVRQRHREMLQSVRRLIAPPALFDRHQIAQALFRTFARLIALHGGTADPYVTILRDEDDKIFVYA